MSVGAILQKSIQDGKMLFTGNTGPRLYVNSVSLNVKLNVNLESFTCQKNWYFQHFYFLHPIFKKSCRKAFRRQWINHTLLSTLERNEQRNFCPEGEVWNKFTEE